MIGLDDKIIRYNKELVACNDDLIDSNGKLRECVNDSSARCAISRIHLLKLVAQQQV